MIEPKPRRSKPNRLRYRVLGQIGRGGMADVHLALAEGPGGFSKLVVLKQLRKQQGQDQEQDEDLDQSQEHDQFELFSDEARIAGRLSHPNVVQTIEETEAGGAPMLVMEYLEGQPLSSILRKCTGERRVEDVPILLRIVAEALQGLHYAHELRDFDGKPLALVHRDVSPQNIFVTYGGEVKVLDFGIAKATITVTETGEGMTRGKVEYVSPEHLLGNRVDRRADVYAVGSVLWFIATGQPLWREEAPGRALLRLLRGEVPAPSAYADDVHPRLEEICLKALSVRPDDRPPTALALHNELEALLRDIGPNLGTREIAAFVTSRFREERATASAWVEQRIAKVNRRPKDSDTASQSLSTSGRFPDPLADTAAPLTLTASEVQPIPSQAVAEAMPDDFELAVAAGRRRRKLGVAFALGGVALGVLVLILISLLRGSSTPSDDSSMAASSGSAAPQSVTTGSAPPPLQSARGETSAAGREEPLLPGAPTGGVTLGTAHQQPAIAGQAWHPKAPRPAATSKKTEPTEPGTARDRIRTLDKSNPWD